MTEAKTTTCGSKHAFTLVELLAVVVIMGLVAGFSMMMVGHDDVYYAAGTAMTIEQVIETAQQEAVRRQKAVCVYFLSDLDYILLACGTINPATRTFTAESGFTLPFGTSYSPWVIVDVQTEVRSGAYIGTVNLGSGSQNMFFNSNGEPINLDNSPISNTNYLLAGYGNKVFKLSIKPVTGTVGTSAY